MQKTENIRLSEQSLYIPSLTKSDSTSSPLGLDTILSQITFPRRISASHGNILRTLDAGKAHGSRSNFPASAELEEAVKQSMKFGRSPHSRVQVWALVGRNDAQSIDIQKSLESGARLHRVLSGGGGWGLREGLVALDPRVDFDDGHVGLAQ